MKSENINFLLTLLFVGGIVVLYLTDSNSENSTSPYGIILALSLPQILRIFPKMRDLGVGSSEFIPDLYSYIQQKLRRSE